MYRRLIAISFLLCIFLCSCGPDPGTSEAYSTQDAADYDKSAIIEKYGGDLDSDLSIFPDELKAEETKHTAHFDPNLFDTDAVLILECVYSKDDFEAELGRISSLSKTIDYEDEQYTNDVFYDENSYNYPAYITIDGFGNTYEYALIDKDESRIIYLYLAYPAGDTLSQYKDFVKKDLSAYEEERTLNSFSMYNHSFDGGESWIEFDDDM